MNFKSLEEITHIKESCQILSKVHGKIAKYVQPGITTEKLDQLAAQYIAGYGAQPSFKGYKGFPATLCVSVNDQVVHGIPSKYELKEGDVVSIDCGVFYKGYHSDAAFSYGVGNISKESLNLLLVTEQALYLGIEQVKITNRIGDIGYAIESYVRSKGYKVIKEYGGHGIGKKLHEDPYIPNFGKRNTGKKLKEKMVLAIEPIVTSGSGEISHGTDNWSVYSKDHQPVVHFEHTVALIDGRATILTTYQYIKEVLKQYG